MFCGNFSLFIGVLGMAAVSQSKGFNFFILIYISVDGKDYVGGDTICVFFLLVFLVVGYA